jgi:branched-chain amino acid transport system substrate-binding protein
LRVAIRFARALLPAACLAAAGLSAAILPARSAEPFNIDVILPLTGPAAFLGTAEHAALQRAETVLSGEQGIAGRPVHFVFHDDQSSPQVAVQIATQVVSTKPPVILGSGLVAMCNAMAPLMRRGPVMYCFSPGIYPASGSFVFSSSVSTRDLATAQIRYFREKRLTKLAIITSTDASGQDAARHLKEILAFPENKDMQTVAETTFNPTDVSAAAQVDRLKAANPQAVIAWSTGAAIGTVFKAIQDSGMDVPVATTDGNMTYSFMQRYAEILPKQLYIASPDWLLGHRDHVAAEVEKAKQQFFDAFGDSGKPDAASTYSWEPAMLIISVLRKLGPDATAEQVRGYLASLTGFAGVNGVYDFVKFPQRGLDDGSVVVTLWNKSKGTWDVVSAPRGSPLQ